MRTILYIGNSYCSCTAELKSIIDKSPAQESPLGKELLCALKDGTLEKWLNEGNAEEQSLAKELPQVHAGASDSELLRKLGECFKSNYKTQALNISDFIVLQKVHATIGDRPATALPLKSANIYCRLNDVAINPAFHFNFKVEKTIGEKASLYVRIKKNDEIAGKSERREINLRELSNTLEADFSLLYERDIEDKTTIPLIELVSEFMGEETILWNSRVSCDIITVGDISFKMIYVEGGTFKMGDGLVPVHPIHYVTLDSFFIAETQVTQELWEYIMGSNPSYNQGLQNPVECISWENCRAFTRKLNKITGLKFRLPTEAEWEYAAKGGNKSKGYLFCGGNDPKSEYFWYAECSKNHTHPVKQLKPNELGIYDMSGNVWEWCYDRYDTYPSSPQVNPKGAEKGEYRILRGGSYDNNNECCATTYRNHHHEKGRSDCFGLRLALDA